MDDHQLQPTILLGSEKANQEEKRQATEEEKWLQTLTKNVREQFELKMIEILKILMALVGLTASKEFILSQSVRAAISVENQDLLRTSSCKRAIDICVKSLKWYSKTFEEEIQRHFEPKVIQQIQPTLNKKNEILQAYFKEPGRVVIKGKMMEIITDSEYGTLTSSQMNEIILTALAAIEHPDIAEFEVRLRSITPYFTTGDHLEDPDTMEKASHIPAKHQERLLDELEAQSNKPKNEPKTQIKPNILDNNLEAQDSTKEELQTPDSVKSKSKSMKYELEAYDSFESQNETEELATLKKGYSTGLNTLCRLNNSSTAFSPDNLTSPLCWTLTGSQLTELYLTAAKNSDAITETSSECKHEFVTPSKGYRISPSVAGSLCDRCRLFPHVFITPPLC